MDCHWGQLDGFLYGFCMVNPMVNNINKRGKPIFGMKKNWINGSTGFVILLAQQKRLRIWIRWIIRFPWNSEQKKTRHPDSSRKIGWFGL
jgi:hypothetical protein